MTTATMPVEAISFHSLETLSPEGQQFWLEWCKAQTFDELGECWFGLKLQQAQVGWLAVAVDRSIESSREVRCLRDRYRSDANSILVRHLQPGQVMPPRRDPLAFDGAVTLLALVANPEQPSLLGDRPGLDLNWGRNPYVLTHGSVCRFDASVAYGFPCVQSEAWTVEIRRAFQ